MMRIYQEGCNPKPIFIRFLDTSVGVVPMNNNLCHLSGDCSEQCHIVSEFLAGTVAACIILGLDREPR